ncbi:hypothetical protein E8E12_001881 [Didymella heteroderae]|uniref:Uncharacterized protein n=1 Tax=Didymella heteroderae TaxID=1769908 RepID=A0A9P4WI41_9PLEO|nr:hypothetical protein E8E12_001881 [Didymella heteroderae]
MQVVKGRVMPRPCQKRRARVAAQKGAITKPTAPPKPKSTTPARGKPGRGRGRGRGGRGGNVGGRPSRGQNSQDGQGDMRPYFSRGNNTQDGAEEFRSFVEAHRSGNQFGALNNKTRAGGGSEFNPITFDDSDDGSDLEEGELSDDGSDMDDTMSEIDTDGSADDMMINLGEVRTQRGRPQKAEVMFTALEAVTIYHGMHQAGFPLAVRKKGRFDARGEVTAIEINAVYTNNYNGAQNAHIALPPYAKESVPSRNAGDHSTRSSTYVSDFPRGQQPAANSPLNARPARPRLPDHDFVKDYVFDWGKYKGSHISDVPESYLRTIGGQSFVFDGRHPGLKEAFDYNRSQVRHAATNGHPAAQEPVQAPRRVRGGASPYQKFRLPKGAHSGKRLDEVGENYVRTLEGMPTVVNSWPGLREALADFNEKTGRQGKYFPEPVV